jgi:DNA-binding MarR family transcriptional regulator
MPKTANYLTDKIPVMTASRPAAHPPLDADQQAKELGEELYRVLFGVFLVLGRRDHNSALPGDLTLAQLSILMALREYGPMRMTTLADHLRVRTPTATVAIRRLMKLGLVARSRDSTDLRAVVVRMTSRGDALCRDALAAKHLQFAAMLKTLSPADLAILSETLPPLEQLACQSTS